MHDLSRELSSEQVVTLARRILAGDSIAEAEVLHHFTPRIFALLCARVRDREAARDLLHDVLIALLRALREGQLREPEKLTAFTLGIARNIAHSYIRTGIRKREVPLASESVRSPLDLLEDEERRRHISQALDQLDSADRQILRMTLVDGHKPGVISKILGMSSDVVRQRKTRATRKVAEYLRNLSERQSQTS